MPSTLNELMLTEVKGAVADATALILVDSSRLTSADTLKLRKDLRGVGAKLKVSKVSVLARAVPASITKLCEGARSSLGVVVAQDMVAAAKIVAELAKEDKVSLKGGLMDGQALDAATVKKISELPGKQQLRGMLVNLLASPIVSFARVIAEIEKKKAAG